MPKRSQASITAPDCAIAHLLRSSNATSFVWETSYRTVLKFVNPCCQQFAASDLPDAAFTAMQRLVAIINTLRSSQPSLDEPFQHLHHEAQALEALIPYVSEEAYDVLDALRQEQPPAFPSPVLPGSGPQAANSHALITIETLVPYMLWSIARSDYRVMRLIEGVRVQCWQPDQGWAAGMLRLVVMLEVKAPTVGWCFDLATGLPVEQLLETDAIIQSDEQALPIRQTTQTAAKDGVGDITCQVDHQLQGVLRLLQAQASWLTAFLQGIPVDLLQPAADWQAGELQLKFGFTFSAQATDSQQVASQALELVEAELMEEAGSTEQSTTSRYLAKALEQALDGSMTKAQVSVSNSLWRSLSPATLVRVTDTLGVEHYAQKMARQQFAQSLMQLRSQQTDSDDEHKQLAPIVQAAIAACSHAPTTLDISLSEPMLLMDELIPNLMWSVTSSTYEVMQWLGGLPTQVLQPKAHWQQGTLRFLAVLQIKAADNIDCTFDLSTGRLLLANATPLAMGTIVQSIILPQQPTSIEALTALLHQQLCDAVPVYALLRDGVSMAWLEEGEQDWQTGTMQLGLKLAFVADAL